MIKTYKEDPIAAGFMILGTGLISWGVFTAMFWGAYFISHSYGY